MQLPENTLEQLDEAIASVEARPSLAEREDVLRLLRAARADAVRAFATPLHITDPALGSEELVLSLLLSSASGGLPPSPEVMRGTGPGEDEDPGWIGSLVNYLRFRFRKVPFRTYDERRPGSGIIPVAEPLTLAMAGDWGMDNAPSSAIGRHLAALDPSYTIHLGDVYYSGTPTEEQQRFVSRWPAGSRGALALNSNHEMYAGGEGYFSVALADPLFKLQGGVSYFALESASWIVFGMDSAYASHACLYQKGTLDPVQLRFLATHAARARAAGKHLMVLTHHQPIDFDGSWVHPLCDDVTRALGAGEVHWYWGHVHGVAVLAPQVVNGVTVHGRCIGHGSIPYEPAEQTAAMEWTEPEKAGDPREPRRAINGFVSVRLDRSGIDETFHGEDGSVRYAAHALAQAA
jgi:hypothetical protein